MTNKSSKNILWFKEISSNDVELVGGKNASLGEMYSRLTRKGVNIPNGFALTSNAYWYILKANNIDKKLEKIFKKYNKKSIKSLEETGKLARNLILKSRIPKDLEKEIIKNYRELSKESFEFSTDVAVRSSGTAEDLANASFAGQHETYLNVHGEKNLIAAIKKCIASMFSDRAIAYSAQKGFLHMKVALSVGIQKMVRSDLASSGVMFSLDTETGFQNVVLINSIYGLGEMIVKGRITPDEFFVFKPTLGVKSKSKEEYKPIILKNLGKKTKKYIYGKNGGIKEVSVPLKKQLSFSLDDNEILTLAKWACIAQDHYKTPQDMEWAKDGKTGKLFVVQSRPETVYSTKKHQFLKEYTIKAKSKPILTGIAVGNKIGTGKVHIIEDVSKISQFKKGEVLVTKMTDPDWVSIFPLASAIVTDQGGKTCHAAIVSRELGIPCIVGTQKATRILKNNQEITVDCTQGLDGRIWKGKVPYKEKKYDLTKIKKPKKVKIMVNIGAPEIAFKTSFLPNDGVGLAREEFIIAEKIKIHPLALYHFNKIKDKKLKEKIEKLTVEHKDKKEYFIKELAEGIGQIAAAFWPNPVIVRFSDFKTNEYAKLIGGQLFEPKGENNPMLGWRGASRYYDKKFEPAFVMECKAIKRVRDVFGLKNVEVMVPFCRTVQEGEKVLKIMEKAGLKRGKDGLKVYVMCEIPSNVILAKEFLKIFDGFSIGSNDLTQLTLGIDRDSAFLQKIGNENNLAVKLLIKQAIKITKEKNKYCGICGQAPSDFPDFAKFIAKEGIKSISLNPDTVIKTIINLRKIGL